MNHKWKALIRLIVFTFIFVVVFLILEHIFFDKSQIHPTWDYVTGESSEPIDILFVGNSHTYTSIDAEVISLATDLNVRSLTCSSINGEIVAADLGAFLNYSVPKVVVLEMCPFSTDNFELMRNEKLGIVFQHFDGIPDVGTRFEATKNVANFEDILSGTFQLLRNTSMWTRYEEERRVSHTYDVYGSDKRWAVYNEGDFYPQKIEQCFLDYIPTEDSECMNQRNRVAFHKILNLSEEYGFDIWVYNAPLRNFSDVYANALNYVYSLQKEYPSIKYIDNSMTALQYIGISKTDFYDVGHLNPNGMQKTTMWMMEKVASRFGVKADVSDIARYKACSMEFVGDERFRYQIETYAEALYQFQYVDFDGNEVITDWDAQNWIEENMILPENISVSVKQIDAEHESEEIIEYPFMPYTLSGYTIQVLENGEIQVKNESNFADNLEYAWYLYHESDKPIERYWYQADNTITIQLRESGKYSISAFVRHENKDVVRGEDIMTLTYNAETGEIIVEKQLKSVVVL